MSSPADIIAFEKYIFAKHVELLREGKISKQFASRMAVICRSLADILRECPTEVERRVQKLNEMYQLLREFGYDIPN